MAKGSKRQESNYSFGEPRFENGFISRGNSIFPNSETPVNRKTNNG